MSNKEKLFIKNRKGLKLCVEFNKNSSKDSKLIFVEHGLGSSKDKPHIKLMSDMFYKHGYTTVTFDATNSDGESGGSFEKVTFTDHYEDLEDVIEWSKTQDWYEEPFALAGHSLGAMATTLFTEKNPDKVDLLIPISIMTSGRNFLKAEELSYEPWRDIIPQSFREDLLCYNITLSAARIKCPTHVIIGDSDTVSLPSCAEEFYKALNCVPRSFQLLKDCPHRVKEKLSSLEEAITNVIKNPAI